MRPPKKSLGQHFLTDVATAQCVVDAAGIGPGMRVLEIGPGRGFLTRGLLAAGACVTVIEKDDALAAALPGLLGAPALEVVHADFLHTDLAQHAGCVLVGNLPYNVSLPILRRALDLRGFWPRMVFMFQLEVARRLTAQPGNRDFGIPTVMVAATHTAQIVRKVPAGAFFPRPKVDSALVLFEPLSAALVADAEREDFIAFVSAVFRYRRKSVANAVALAAGRNAAGIACAMAAADLPPTARPETFSPASLVRLWKCLEAEGAQR